MIKAFHWLKDQLQFINDDSSALLVYLCDDACRQLKEYFTIMINSRSSENHLNSILALNMGSDFESPKHLY